MKVLWWTNSVINEENLNFDPRAKVVKEKLSVVCWKLKKTKNLNDYFCLYINLQNRPKLILSIDSLALFVWEKIAPQA